MENPSTVTTVTRKIGSNKGKPRLWIEGKVLDQAGLPHGSRWTLLPITTGGLRIASAPASGKRKVAGNPGRPVIDITSKTLDCLRDQNGVMPEQVVLEFTIGAGVIRVSPCRLDILDEIVREHEDLLAA